MQILAIAPKSGYGRFTDVSSVSCLLRTRRPWSETIFIASADLEETAGSFSDRALDSPHLTMRGHHIREGNRLARGYVDHTIFPIKRDYYRINIASPKL